jgi:hypothetical protein
VGEIHIPAGGLDERITSHWSQYMVELFDLVVQDWVTRVEVGELRTWTFGEHEPISAEHLRVAKQFLSSLHGRTPDRTREVEDHFPRRPIVPELNPTDHEKAWRVDDLPKVNFEVSSRKSDEEDTGEMSEEELETWKKLQKRSDKIAYIETE